MDAEKIIIPFNRPYMSGRELNYIKKSVASGKIGGDADYTKKCEDLLRKTFGGKQILLTGSGTQALEMASLLINLQPGDEVILPSYTFVSTANAIMLRGAKPVFVDIREDTLNIDENKIEEKIVKKTKAIFPVHYAGVGCEMDKIMQIAKKYNLLVVEDAAHAVNAKYKGKYLGTIGNLGIYSFHVTKNYTSGEGGAIVINQEEFLEKAEIIREKGTDKSKFLRGEINKYTWRDVGSSYLISDILAAFLYAQLENLEEIKKKRKEIFDFYYKNLKSLEENGELKLPHIPDECQSNHHIFYIILKGKKERNRLMNYLTENGIQAVFHYIPLHTSAMGKKLGYKEGGLPVTEDMSARLLRLPFYLPMKEGELDFVIENINTFFGEK